ncbi:MAG: hypothetical protein NT163_03170 [Chlorobiales bacterium]|nr:hypothetical protein [Chlorobiales bacterium]
MPVKFKVVFIVLIMAIAVQVSVVEGAGRWIYEKIREDVSQNEVSTATLQSKNSIKLPFPYAGVNHALIMIRKVKGGDAEVLFAVDKGKFYTGDKIRVKFDGGNADWITVDKPSDRSSDLLFIYNPKIFINQLRTAKELKIAAQFSQYDEHVFDFDVDGLDLTKVGL